ncbi:MAG: response regulator [Planctomycetes bacterium]|nr:response regulator [Planctomycetota bacterium]
MASAADCGSAIADCGMRSEIRNPKSEIASRGEVLVVDDEAGIRELLLASLAGAGYRGAAAATAAEALDALRQRPPDVMLCDLLLPQMSGVELLVKTRIEAPDTSVIVVTAVSDIETALRSVRLGAYDYLVKPVSPSDVVLRVGSALDMRRHVVEARLARQRLEANSRQLEELAEVKDSLVQMLVHDLKSPLASAMGYMELLERKDAETFSERQLNYLHRAYTSCKDVLRMTTTLLDLTRLEKGVLELQRAPLDLRGLLREAAAEIEPLIFASGGTVEVACDPAAGTPLADRELVRRVVSNLLANAAKYSPPGSSVRLGAQPGGEGFSAVFVADNGKGIPPEEREAIFQKYHQLPAHRGMGGAGIGLAFCRMAVEAHGGRIWVESAPGQGSTFRFTLPVSPDRPCCGKPSS